ncbi:MAG: adenylate/guanylate cyclase domain-containing protein, partial [Candidatus Sumerlaeota bacterium]
MPQFVAKEFLSEENELDASVEQRFGEFDLHLSRSQKRRIVEFLKSSDDQYRSGTVMFADITSYTKLCQELKAEYVHEIIRIYYAIFSNTVESYNGFVVEFAGDGALAVFGAPIAFERDAEGAMRAAVDIRERVRSLPKFQGCKIRISIGIATGEILSAVVRETSPPHYKIVGQAVNLAARVQSSAESDSIVIEEETKSLAGNSFELLQRPPREFKNVEGLITTYVVQSILYEKTERAQDIVKFIGREKELAELNSRWTAWCSGAGEPAIRIVAEAGLGKSRVTREFLRRISTEARSVIADASPFQARVPYGVWRSVLGELIAKDGVPNRTHTESQVDEWLRLHGFADDETDPVKMIFGFNSAVEGPLAGLPAQTIFRLVCADLKRLLTSVRRSGKDKLLLFFDDLQWSDRSSLEILSWMLRTGTPDDVFLVLSHRSDFTPLSAELAQLPSLPLHALEERDRRALFNILADGRAILPELRDRIIQHAEGNPLYLIEFFTTLGKATVQGKGLEAMSSKDWIPPSLRQMIQARIDALEDRRKNVLQAASVIGRQFATSLLQVFDHIKQDLVAQLYALKSAEFLHDHPAMNELLFSFQQNLTREV